MVLDSEFLNDDVSLLRHQVSRLTDIFRDFRDKRVAWDMLAKRRNPIQLQPELSRYAEGIDIQSPDLEWAITQHVNILMLNGTKIDCTSLDADDKARSDVDDIRIWLGCEWRKQNDNRRLDKAVGRSLVKYGVSILRLFWNQPDADEDDNDDTYGQDCFRLEHVNPIECAWWPLKDPEIFTQESIVKWVDAYDWTGLDGNWVTLDEFNNLHYSGEREPLHTWNSFASRVPNIRVITRAAINKDTGDWELAEYIYPANEEGNVLQDKDPLKLSSCIVPINRCPFFVIPGAGEDNYEQDPHLRYRPMMYRLYVIVQEYNYWRTVLSAMARKYSGDNVVYLNLSTIKPEAAAILEQVFPTEGSGANRRLTFTLPEPNSGELAVSPSTIERWPAEIEQHALAMFEECKRLLTDAMPNRFMTGEAFGEVRDGTGAAVISMTESARIPYSAELTMIDGFAIKQPLQAMVDCILQWDEDSPDGAAAKYYAVVLGNEPKSRYGKPPLSPGSRVYVDAKKLRRPYNIEVLTRNLTQAEESQEALMAGQDMGQGLITKKQFIALRGGAIPEFFNDPEKQIIELDKESYRLMQKPHTDQLILQSLNVLFSAQLGINTAALMGLNLPQPPQSVPQGGGGQAFELSPNRTQGGPPVWKPGDQASSLPPIETRGGSVDTRSSRSGPAPFAHPTVTPPPIQGPTGGNSGVR